jgi:ubiquinone/menaquinone biosynthesis C-methylase UbiE
MDVLGLRPGTDVADIGAGSGWFTVRAARRVTGQGVVFAVDINPQAVLYVQKRAAKENLRNVRVIQGRPDDPVLPANSVDSVLLLKTYHEVAKPIDLMRNLKPALKPRARVGIIDRDGNGENHGVAKDVVIREAKQAGYQLLEEHDDLVKDDGMDYFLVFGVRP